MKLYKIYQNVNTDYDSFDSAVVCAETPEDAKTIHPAEYKDKPVTNELESYDYTWASLNDIQVEYLGEATEGIERGIILASFNAG